MNGTDASVFRDFVTALPRTDRLIFLLHYADGLTPDEIGAVLHVESRDVTDWLDRLREQARQVMRAIEAAKANAPVAARA